MSMASAKLKVTSGGEESRDPLTSKRASGGSRRICRFGLHGCGDPPTNFAHYILEVEKCGKTIFGSEINVL